MPERVGLDPVVAARGEADARQRAVDPAVRASRSRAAAWTCRFSRPVRCAVKARLLDDRADARERRGAVAGQVVAEQAHAARGRLGEAEQQPDQRRLAGAVGAEEAEGDAARHLEVDAVERRAIAEPLAQIGGVDRQGTAAIEAGEVMPPRYARALRRTSGSGRSARSRDEVDERAHPIG